MGGNKQPCFKNQVVPGFVSDCVPVPRPVIGGPKENGRVSVLHELQQVLKRESPSWPWESPRYRFKSTCKLGSHEGSQPLHEPHLLARTAYKYSHKGDSANYVQLPR